jgi:glycosyltransferase involved in cell wall biosynthesis
MFADVPARPVRVLLIAPQAPILGGQGVQAQRLVASLEADPSVDVTFLPMNPRLRGGLAFLHDIKLVKTAVTLALFIAKLLPAALRTDVIHVFAAGNFSFLFAPAPAILAGKLFGKPVIVNYRDGRAEQHLANWVGARRLLSWATAIVSPSEYLVDVFAKFGLKAQSIPNVIDPSAFHYRERPRPRPVFLHNRGFEELYNIPCTLRAFQIIQRRYADARLILTHDGPLRSEMERLAAELGLRNVEFRGRVSQQETPGILDEADVYLTSPNLDCMPGSLLECYASGLPMVATAAGGIPYIVDDGRTGLLVPLNDPEAMAAAAIRLLEEGGLAERLARSGQAELGKYDWETSVRDQWVGLYRRLGGVKPELAPSVVEQ